MRYELINVWNVRKKNKELQILSRWLWIFNKSNMITEIDENIR